MPSNWKELQNDVAEFFNDLGFSAYTPFMCTNESISFEIDVFVEKVLSGIPIRILVECKYWESVVPQDVIFSMITRVNKFGANTGIIISKKGFQKGAISSVKNTNILLYSFNDFIDHFKNEWLDVQLNLTYKELNFFDSVKWDCFLDIEEIKGRNSNFIKTYGYLYLIYRNMCSGYCTNHENYSDDGFLNLIPQKIVFPNCFEYKVEVLGDAFRLLLKTDFLNQIDDLTSKNI